MNKSLKQLQEMNVLELLLFLGFCLVTVVKIY